MKKNIFGLGGLLSLLVILVLPSIASAAIFSANTVSVPLKYQCNDGIGNQAWDSPFLNNAYSYAQTNGASASQLSAFDSAMDSFFAGPYGFYGNVRTSGNSSGSLSWGLLSEQGSNQDLVPCYGEISVNITAPSSTGSISASPSPCSIISGSVCSSTVNWSFLNTNNVQIYVRSSGVLFATDSVSPGSQTAPWITDAGYWFDLRTNSTSNNSGTLLSSVFVEGNYPTYTLNVNSSGLSAKAITASPSTYGGTTNYTKTAITSGTSITLTAPAVSGYTVSWSGTGCSSATASVTVSMTATRTCTAGYTLVANYILSVAVNPSGGGTVASVPAGISCGVDCTESYNSGTLVTLTATPKGGYSFASWTGACLGQTSVCTISMNADKSITANFSTVPPPTSITATCNSPANGQVTVSWTPPTGGAPAYYFRADNNGGGACPADAGEVCTGPVAPASYTFSPTLGINYDTWVHSCSDNSCSSYSNAISTTFNCSPIPVVNGSCGPGAGTPASAEPTGASACSSGTYTSSPPSNTSSTWWWTCTGSGGGASPTCSANNSSYVGLSVSCVANPTPALIGQPVVWTATPSGGSGTYTSYVWSGTNLSPAPTTNPFTKVYGTIGQKTATVTVTDSEGVIGTCVPTGSLQVNFDPDLEEF